MGKRFKRPKEESVVSSFRIPKIEDPEEKEFFRYCISAIINDLEWMYYSTNPKNLKKNEKNPAILDGFKKNIDNAQASSKNLINFAVEHYKEKRDVYYGKDAKQPFCSTEKETLSESVIQIQKKPSKSKQQKLL